jgi:hypothetical protein
MALLFLRTNVLIYGRMISSFRHTFEAVYVTGSEVNIAAAAFSFKYELCRFILGWYNFC